MTSEAGKKLIAKFMDAERRGRLVALCNNLDGSPAGFGLPLPRGDGGALAAAQKLARDGQASLVGGRHRRYLIITDAGRSA